MNSGSLRDQPSRHLMYLQKRAQAVQLARSKHVTSVAQALLQSRVTCKRFFMHDFMAVNSKNFKMLRRSDVPCASASNGTVQAGDSLKW